VPLLFGFTTPQLCDAARDATVQKLNKEAAAILKKHDVQSVDLHAAILSQCGPAVTPANKTAPQRGCALCKNLATPGGCFCPHDIGGGHGYAWLANTTIAPAILKTPHMNHLDQLSQELVLPPPPPRLAHFAWWHDVVEDTHTFSSFTFGTPDRPARSGAGALPINASWLVYARSFGVQGMWNVEGAFFSHSVTRDGLALRSDWRDRWEAVAAAAAPLLENGTMFGFFIGDELYPQKVTPAELRTAADAVRADFPAPSVVTWVNFCACPPFGKETGAETWTPGEGYDIPSSLSWASVDVYDGLRQSAWPSTPFVPRVQVAVSQLLVPKLQPNQSLMLVPGSWATNLTSQAGWCAFK
jgi:hypothetical protein